MQLLRHGILQSGGSSEPAAEITSLDVWNGEWPDDDGLPLKGLVYYDCTVAGDVDIDWEIWDEYGPELGTRLFYGTESGVTVTVGTDQELLLYDDFTGLNYPTVEYEYNVLVMWIGNQTPVESIAYQVGNV